MTFGCGVDDCVSCYPRKANARPVPLGKDRCRVTDKSRADEVSQIMIDAWVEWCSVNIHEGGSGPADLDAFLADMRALVEEWAGWGGGTS